jgi:hypothetical protein
MADDIGAALAAGLYQLIGQFFTAVGNVEKPLDPAAQRFPWTSVLQHESAQRQ